MAVHGPGSRVTVGCEVGLCREDPVYIRLRSTLVARGECAEPVVMKVMPFNTWQMVKHNLRDKCEYLKSVPDRNIRLLYKGLELVNSKKIWDVNLSGGETEKKPLELQYLIIARNATGNVGQGEAEIGMYVDSGVPDSRIQATVDMALGAMLTGIQPQLTEEGTGATYMLRDSTGSRTIGVFKPKDEEAFAPQNPRGYVAKENTASLKPGVLSTEQAAREVAAFLLDRNVAGIPPTGLVHAKHPKFVKVRGSIVWKIGSFQEFVNASDTCGNYAPQVFSTDEVHRIGILDMRIINLDRNEGNMLVDKLANGRLKLIPIDHGLSLPDRLEVYADDLAWMSWPQAHKPFRSGTMEIIRRLNGAQDAQKIARLLGIRRDCLRLMEVTTKLLQIGAEAGLTLYDIGSIIYRQDRDDESETSQSTLERIITSALDAALGAHPLDFLDLHITSTASEALEQEQGRHRPGVIRSTSCKVRAGIPSDASIFARPGLEAAGWSEELEKAFQRYVLKGLEDQVKKIFRVRCSPALSQVGSPIPRSVGSGPEPIELELVEEFALPTALMPSSSSITTPCDGNSSGTAAGAGDKLAEEGFSALGSPKSSPKSSSTKAWRPKSMVMRLEDAGTEANASKETQATEAPTASSSTGKPQDGAKTPWRPRSMVWRLESFGEEASSPTGSPKGSQPWIPRSRSGSANPFSILSSTPKAVKLPSKGSKGTPRWGYCVDQGQRQGMEDAVDTCLDIGMLADCEVDRTEFYAVYDGHGGVDAVDYVLHNIPKKIVGHDGFADGTVAGMKEAISHGVREVDEELAKLLATRFPPETLADTKTTPGCVGTMVLIRSVQVVIANLGDCRAIWSEDGKMELLTADHRPAVNEAEKARLQAMGVEVSCDGYIHSKLEVCRAWGDFGSQGKLPGLIAEPEVFEKTVTDITEFLVLACDGVFEKLSWEEVGRIARRKLRSGGDPKAAAEAIITMAVKAGTSDNVSCTVVLFKAPPQIERSSSRPWGMSSFKLSEMADTSPPIAEPTGALPAAAL